ncbi:unnamed protein product, partial [Durusdinium trenchii]
IPRALDSLGPHEDLLTLKVLQGGANLSHSAKPSRVGGAPERNAEMSGGDGCAGTSRKIENKDRDQKMV